MEVSQAQGPVRYPMLLFGIKAKDFPGSKSCISHYEFTVLDLQHSSSDLESRSKFTRN